MAETVNIKLPKNGNAYVLECMDRIVWLLNNTGGKNYGFVGEARGVAQSVKKLMRHTKGKPA